MLEVLPGLGDRGDVGVKEEGRAEAHHRNRNRNILKADSKIGDVTVFPIFSGLENLKNVDVMGKKEKKEDNKV